jgi:hypothetical protein
MIVKRRDETPDSHNAKNIQTPVHESKLQGCGRLGDGAGWMMLACVVLCCAFTPQPVEKLTSLLPLPSLPSRRAEAEPERGSPAPSHTSSSRMTHFDASACFNGRLPTYIPTGMLRGQVCVLCVWFATGVQHPLVFGLLVFAF